MEFTRIEELRHTSSKKFLKVASKHYGIGEEAFSSFLEDYDIEPKGAFGPSGLDAVPLLMREIAERVGLPVPVVGRLQDTGVICTPISCDDITFLQMYRQASADTLLLSSLHNVMTASPDFTEKWQRWVYMEFFFTDIEARFCGQMASMVWKAPITHVADDVGNRYGISICQSTKDEIFEIRETAYDDRQKVNQGKVSERYVLKCRGLPESEFELFKDTFVFDLYS